MANSYLGRAGRLRCTVQRYYRRTGFRRIKALEASKGFSSKDDAFWCTPSEPGRRGLGWVSVQPCSPDSLVLQLAHLKTLADLGEPDVASLSRRGTDRRQHPTPHDSAHRGTAGRTCQHHQLGLRTDPFCARLADRGTGAPGDPF